MIPSTPWIQRPGLYETASCPKLFGSRWTGRADIPTILLNPLRVSKIVRERVPQDLAHLRREEMLAGDQPTPFRHVARQIDCGWWCKAKRFFDAGLEIGQLGEVGVRRQHLIHVEAPTGKCCAELLGHSRIHLWMIENVVEGVCQCR